MGLVTSELVVDFLDGLSRAHDTKELIEKTLHILPRYFGPFVACSIVFSDPQRYTWRILPIENPRRPSWGGVKIEDLIPDADLDYLAEMSGKEATVALRATPRLQKGFVHGREPFYLLPDDEPAISDLAVLCGANLEMSLAAGWDRHNGGRGWVVLGYDELQPDPYGLLEDFALAVKLMTSMMAYPSLLQFIKRKEKVTDSLRRNIVHDLKTPVSVIKGSSETMQMSLDMLERQDLEEMLGMITEQSDRMLEDLQDILNPLETWTPTFTRFDLSAMIHRAAIDERHTARSAGKTIVVEGADSPIEIDGDLRKLKRMFENLLSNAVKYSPGEGKTVWIKLEQDGEFVRVSFRDQGIGMDEHQLSKVMSETGRVVDQSLGIEGSGYGLDSCRAILAAHGGSLEAASELGRGSTFTAVLPVEHVSPFD